MISVDILSIFHYNILYENRIKKRKLLSNKLRNSRWEAQISKRKFNWHFSTSLQSTQIHLISSDWEKDLCECQNISIQFPCIYLCLSSRDLFIFFSKSFPFSYIFLCYTFFGAFHFHMIFNIMQNLHLLEYLAEAFQCHVHHYQCLTISSTEINLSI